MGAPAPASVLAFVSTVHLALGLLVNHRKRGRRRFTVVSLPSFLFVTFPWLLPSPVWLALGFALNVAWLAACEKLVPSFPHGGPVAGTPASSPVPSASAARPARGGFCDVEVLAVLDETPEIRTFRLSRPRGFEFTPGQFLMIRVEVGGRRQVRCYSISSAPEARGYLEISVRRQGLVSDALHRTLRAGGTATIQGPGGHFVYPRENRRPMVLHAGGVGITPMISMLRHAVASEPGRRVTLLYTARTEADVAFRSELELLGARHPEVRVVLALSRGRAREGFHAGRVDADVIRRLLPDAAGCVHLICGPGPMIESVRAALASLGVASRDVRFEAFEAAAAEADGAVAAGGETFTLTLARSGKVVPVDAGVSLLEAAEAAGADIPSLCRSGACGTCKTRLLSGDVTTRSEALSPDERTAGNVLLCVSWARGQCVLDA